MLPADASGLALTALEAAAAEQGPCTGKDRRGPLVVVDQFEQTLTQCTDESERRAFITGHKGHVFSVAFSPGGRILASGSGDETIQLWRIG